LAFALHYSTKYAVLSITDQVQLAIESHIKDNLDFGKAIDTVNHQILITKLDYKLGIKGVAKDWLTSYLSNSLFLLVPLIQTHR